MHLVIEKAPLLSALSRIHGVVERRNTIPILGNMAISASEDTLSLMATDLELAITGRIPAPVRQAGETTAPAQMLHDIVRKLPDGAVVEIGHDPGAGRLKLCSERISYDLPTLPREDFPVMAEDRFGASFPLAGNELRRLLDKTRFAVSTDDTRPYLGGVHLHPHEEKGQQPRLRAVSTDGHRLARVDTALPGGAAQAPPVIIPRKTVHELWKLLDDVGEDADISLSDTMMRVRVAGTSLLTKLIDGKFPDYERVIPADNTRLVEVMPRLLIPALERVSLISSDRTAAVRLSFSQDRLLVSASSQELGSAEEELPVVHSGEAFGIGFNPRYLLEVMGRIGSETAQLFFGDSSAPLLVRDMADDSAVFVVMPMRL